MAGRDVRIRVVGVVVLLDGGPAGSQEMKYSAISDCGSEEQRVSLPSTPSAPESSTVTIARLAASTSRSVTSPALTPAIRTSEPVDEPERVVHLDLVGVRVVGPGRGREHGDRGGDQREDEGDPPHGPGGTWLGSQVPGSPLVSAPPSVNGTEWSDGSMSLTGRSLPPGQRWVLPVESAAASSLGAQRLAEIGAAAGLREAEGVEGRLDPADAAGRVDGAGVAEVVEPADELRRVGAEEGERGVAVLKRADGLAEGALGVVVVGGHLQVVGVLGAGAAVGRAGADRASG